MTVSIVEKAAVCGRGDGIGEPVERVVAVGKRLRGDREVAAADDMQL